MRGSVLVTFDEFVNDRGADLFTVNVNSTARYQHTTDSDNLYTTYVNLGDVVRFSINYSPSSLAKVVTVKRIDYTTDDEGGDKGVKETQINPTIVTDSSGLFTIEFTCSTIASAYSYRYVINAETFVTPTPTPTPTMTPTPTPTPLPPPIGFNNFTNSILETSDNKLFIGGAFTTYNNQSYPKLVKLNDDGTIDTSFVNYGFNVSPSIQINSLGIQSDNKILAVGFITEYSGVTFKNLIRLNTNGTIDTSYNAGIFCSNSGCSTFTSNSTIAIQSDNKAIIGGNFNFYSGTPSSKIIRLNTDGTIDTSFNIGTGFLGSRVHSVNLLSDGKMYVGGEFSQYNGNNYRNLIKLNSDASIDTSFNIGTGFEQVLSGQGTSSVLDTKEQADNKLIVIGNFTRYNGTNINRIVRLNTDGTIDTSFSGVTSGFSGFFNLQQFRPVSLDIQPDGKIVVVGSYITYNGVTVNRIVRLNTDGSIDNTFNTGTGFNATVNQVKVLSDNTILVVGDSSVYNGSSIGYIVRLNTNGTRISWP